MRQQSCRSGRPEAPAQHVARAAATLVASQATERLQCGREAMTLQREQMVEADGSIDDAPGLHLRD
jgi:hypothetical protein